MSIRMDRRAGEHKPEGFAPLVSVIAVVFRDRVELQKIVESVAPFRSERLELIVIDGGSKDGTLEFLQSNGEEIDFWMSEPDRGIYDAMNKGIQAARGEYVLHLNAGDRLRAVPWEAL
ncbi:MAG TPA: glycosyltransferase, partial [Acidobacteriaceae bacterium]|nr:glycosyltransferase [Acidobacteriaceae bacterium]